jgi:hypothetical protein
MIIPAPTKLALYFGCRGSDLGHYFQSATETLWEPSRVHGFPWTLSHMDGGLLKNGKHSDIYDGKVFWTCGGRPLWLAFFWWDNSVDHRGASNSGFYVRGFDVASRQAALDYAGTIFPKVVARQRQPLVLQP